MTKRKPDILGPGEKEHAAQLKIHTQDRCFSTVKRFQMIGRFKRHANNHKRAKAHDQNAKQNWRASGRLS
jgi:hypothetical protein